MIGARRSLSFDWLLLMVTLLLLGLGLLVIGSATANAAKAGVAVQDLPVVRQSINAVMAIAALIAASLINYRFWVAWRWVIYGGMLAALLVVLVAGQVLFGAQSWFEVWSMTLQPSELAKIALIIVLAQYFAEHESDVKRGTGIIVSLLITAPFLALVFAQPDMGTAVVLCAIWLGMLFVAGLRLRHIPLFLLAAVILAPVLWNLMRYWPHMHERILMFLRPNSDPSGADYNVIQALISVGSGGLWGKGLGEGSQSQLAFLRVRHTDFIFSVLAEELGLVGCLMLFSLLAALLLRIIHVSATAGDAFGRLLAGGVAAMILVQVVINIGMNVGILPVTGLPLPLISYGGSSLIATLIGLGLVESVALYSHSTDGE